MNTNEITFYNNTKYPNVEVVTINGEPWFVAASIAKILGYMNISDMVRKHVLPKNQMTVPVMDGHKGNPNRLLVNEAGLFSLIGRASRKREADAFRNWIYEVVLPKRRKEIEARNNPPALMAQKYQRALKMIHETVVSMREHQQKVDQQHAEEMAEIRKEIQKVHSYFSVSTKNWREATIAAVSIVARKNGSKDYAGYYHEMYDMLEKETGVRLGVRASHMDKKSGKKVSKLDAIAADKKLVKAFISCIMDFARAHDIQIDLKKRIEEVA